LVIDGDTPQDLRADALITKRNDIALAILLADCVPVLLYDPKKKVVAAIHAGWRGTVANITQATIIKMKEQFNCNPQDIIAGIGPSISVENYEVGPEVKEAADLAMGEYHNTVINKNGKLYFDLWKANKLQLLKSGLEDSNIEVSGICTYRNNETFFSARANKPITGRFAAVIKIK
jgi:hypothetical protein